MGRNFKDYQKSGLAYQKTSRPTGLFHDQCYRLKKRHNLDLEEQISILKDKVTRTRMQWNFYRKNGMFFYFSWTKITSNVWTNQIVWRHSQTWNVKIVPKLFDKSFIAFEIWSPHFENRSEVMPIYFFQPVVLFIMLTWYLTLYH